MDSLIHNKHLLLYLLQFVTPRTYQCLMQTSATIRKILLDIETLKYLVAIETEADTFNLLFGLYCTRFYMSDWILRKYYFSMMAYNENDYNDPTFKDWKSVFTSFPCCTPMVPIYFNTMSNGTVTVMREYTQLSLDKTLMLHESLLRQLGYDTNKIERGSNVFITLTYDNVLEEPMHVQFHFLLESKQHN